MSRQRARWVALATSTACVMVALHCDGGGTECECSPAGLTVNVPAALAKEVDSIVPSGTACNGADVHPTPRTDVSTRVFHVSPSQPGPCHLDILFTDGTTFADDVVVIETTGCCAGLRTDPPGAADIDVPSPLEAGSGDGRRDDD